MSWFCNGENINNRFFISYSHLAIQLYIYLPIKTIMSILQVFSILLLATSTTLATVNGPCTINSTPGVCISTASCSGAGGSFKSGFCPNDPTDIKCCVKPSCGSGGNCRFTSQCSGSSKSGLCPGPADFKCCLAGNGGGGSAADHHDLSAHGVQFIAGFEGFRADFYFDSAVSLLRRYSL